MSMLLDHLSSTAQTSDQYSTTSNPSSSFTTGICLFASSHIIASSLSNWIVDSGATRHICSNANAFLSLKIIHNSTIHLLNNTCILVHMCGDVKLGAKLILKDVLFLPQFRFNLIPISALTHDSLLIVNFFSEHVAI